MNIQVEKIELTKLLLNTNSPKILQRIKDILTPAQSEDFWDELSQEQQEEIKLGTQQILEGKITEYETYMAKHR